MERPNITNFFDVFWNEIAILTLKNGAVEASFTFFGRFHTPLAQVSNTPFIDRICKIKVKIKKDKVQTKIVGYENGVKEGLTGKKRS